ncbi:hypothetical protein BDA99DRAFT_564017 [Phascolomyces articulosus]|uniref:Uncharacterized protein n=1 Tax=Phascolomyces articulosus TaxID=60185 RepID=A0AAD5P9J0_9FUNG|nr:hypothetical protein BDA99DRAFT_564017 [Phascolomyces articulosus]
MTLWKTIDFDNQNGDFRGKKNACLLQCLGPHVKTIDVAYEHMLPIFTEFMKHGGCNVVNLSIAPRTDPLTGFYGKTRNNPQFFDILNTIGSHIAKLELYCIHDIPLLQLARVCPLLKNFKFHLDYDVLPHEYFETTMQYNNPRNSHRKHLDNTRSHLHGHPLLPHLLFLELDSKFNFYTRITPFLSHCPNLRIIHLYLHDPDRSIPRHDFDFVQLLVLCPRVFRLECYHDCLPYDNCDDIDLLEKQVANEDTKLNNIKSSREALQALTIIKGCFGGNMLAPSSLAQFMDFYSEQNTMALETVSLHIHSDSLNDQVITSLSNLRGLKSITLNCSSNLWRHHQHTFSGNSQLFSGLRYLEEIDVAGKLFISDQLLEALGVLSCLKSVVLDYDSYNDDTHRNYDDEDENIRKYNHGNLKTLVLKQFHGVLDNVVLEAIGSISSLKKLAIVQTNGISLDALQKFGETVNERYDEGQGELGHNVEVHIQECHGVTVSYLQTVLD